MFAFKNIFVIFVMFRFLLSFFHLLHIQILLMFGYLICLFIWRSSAHVISSGLMASCIVSTTALVGHFVDIYWIICIMVRFWCYSMSIQKVLRLLLSLYCMLILANICLKFSCRLACRLPVIVIINNRFWKFDLIFWLLWLIVVCHYVWGYLWFPFFIALC